MRVSERIDLISKICRELQSRYSYHDIDLFLAQFGVNAPAAVGTNSKWIYSKTALQDQPETLILQIARELQLPHGISAIADADPPATGREQACCGCL